MARATVKKAGRKTEDHGKPNQAGAGDMQRIDPQRYRMLTTCGDYRTAKAVKKEASR